MHFKSALKPEGKGVYTIIVNVNSSAFVHVGRLGLFEFSGLYAYTGSGQGKGSTSLNGRVSRHFGLRGNKKVRWHIDYLLGNFQTKVEGAVLSITNVKSKECEVSKNILCLSKSSPPVVGFGSSDCDCKSHLARLKGEIAAAFSTILKAHMKAELKPELVHNTKLSDNIVMRQESML